MPYRLILPKTTRRIIGRVTSKLGARSAYFSSMSQAEGSEARQPEEMTGTMVFQSAMMTKMANKTDVRNDSIWHLLSHRSFSPAVD